MTVEQQLRDQLARATRDVPTSPDVEVSVQQGRRTRRTRRAGLAIAAVAVVGAAATGAFLAVSGGDGPTVAHDAPVADAPAAATDFVAGTGVDSDLAAAIAEDLPALPAPDDVYPSDSHTNGPLPDADFARAEDWQATYTVGDSDFLVIMAAPSEGGFGPCPDCEKQQVAGGTLYHQTFTSGDPAKWYLGVYFVRPDGSTVNAFESLAARTEQAARADRQLSDADVVALVQDPRLHFTGGE